MCFLGFPLILLASVSIAGTPNKVLTYFSDKKIPWNDAAELCRSRGTRLLTIDSEDVRLALKYLSKNDWSGYWNKRDVWTGLHRINGEYMWHTSCELIGNYTPWARPTQVETKRCVTGDHLLEEGKWWVRRLCENSVAVAVCEKRAGQCTFVERPNYKVQGISPEYKLWVSNVDDCQQACLLDTGQPECWAVIYFLAALGWLCSLYRAQSMAELLANSDGNATHVRSALYVKICFQAQLNHTGLVASFNDPVQDNEPWAGCSEPINKTTPDLSTEDYSGQTSTTTTTFAWLSREVTTTKLRALTNTHPSDSPQGTVSVASTMDQQPTDHVSPTQEINTSIYETEGLMWCKCRCVRYSKLNEVEKKKFTDKLISFLTVNKSNISSNRRRYESAHDPRPSAQSVGWLGLVLLCVTFGGLFLTDFHKLYRDIMRKSAQKY